MERPRIHVRMKFGERYNEAYDVTVDVSVCVESGEVGCGITVSSHAVGAGTGDPPNRLLHTLHMCLSEFYRTFKEGLQLESR